MKAKQAQSSTSVSKWLLAMILSTPVVLLPFSRAFHGVIEAFAILGIFMLMSLFFNRNAFNSSDKALQVLTRLFLFIWLPMLFSLVDTLSPQIAVVLQYPIYVLMALAVIVILRANSIISQIAVIMSWVICVWAADGILQQLLGLNMFGQLLLPNTDGVYVPNSWFASASEYGFYLGLLSGIPLFTMYLCGVNRLTHISVSTLLLGAILMAGSYNSYILFLLAFIPYLYVVFIRPAYRPIVPILILPVLFIAMAFLLWQSSVGEYIRLINANTPLLQYQLVWDIGMQHMINGIGVNAWPAIAEGTVVSHPQQLLIELWLSTGIVGLVGFLLLCLVLLRLWHQSADENRKLALPLIFPVFIIWLPSGNYLSLYQLFPLVLFLLALSIAALTSRSDYQ